MWRQPYSNKGFLNMNHSELKTSCRESALEMKGINIKRIKRRKTFKVATTFVTFLLRSCATLTMDIKERKKTDWLDIKGLTFDHPPLCCNFGFCVMMKEWAFFSIFAANINFEVNLSCLFVSYAQGFSLNKTKFRTLHLISKPKKMDQISRMLFFFARKKTLCLKIRIKFRSWLGWSQTVFKERSLKTVLAT